MNKIAAIIAAGVGGGFMALQIAFPQQMSGMLFGFSLDDFMTGDHARARSAVYKVLIDPQSAAFQDLRTVEAAKAKFVCGKVNSKDKSGVYAGYRAFVYERAGDVAHVDDDGRVVKIQAAYRPCPVSEDAPPAPTVITIPPEAMAVAGKILEALPTIETQVVPPAAAVALGSGGGAGAGGSGGSIQSGVQSLAQSVPQLDRKPGGQGAGNVQSPTKSANEMRRESERDWRGDRPPAAWPVFAVDDPLAKPASQRRRSTAETMALASEVEQRWTNLEAGRSKAKPSMTETREALRALLAVDPASKEFPQAWTLFVRLRKIDRDSLKDT